jgi:hypothetical protein
MNKRTVNDAHEARQTALPRAAACCAAAVLCLIALSASGCGGNNAPYSEAQVKQMEGQAPPLTPEEQRNKDEALGRARGVSMNVVPPAPPAAGAAAAPK